MWEKAVKSPLIPVPILLWLLYRLFTGGLSWAGLILLALSLAWFGLTLARSLVVGRERRRERDDDLFAGEKPLISLVYLLSEPRFPNEVTVRDCVSNALEFDFGDEAFQAAESIFSVKDSHSRSGDLQQFLIRIPQGIFAVIVSSAPYVADPKKFARETIRDKRLRSAIENHQAWISVDRVGAPPAAAEKREAYQVIGKLLGAMAGPDCLAIYSPELETCNEFDPSLIQRLHSVDPLGLFAEPTFEPIIEIEEDNPEMLRAVEEARRRWPEFVEAFRRRQNHGDERFIVKSEFREGNRSEFMWVGVSALRDEGVVGVLMNDPHELVGFHRGQQVTLPVETVNDWLFPSEKNEMVGGFTLRVLSGKMEDPEDEE